MKIGIYNPYLDSFGGGERYTLTAASHWSGKHSVDIFWDKQDDVHVAAERFGLDLSRVKTVRNIFAKAFILEKLWQTKMYDFILFVSDGSVPASLAKRNVIHFQVPFERVYLSVWKQSMYQAIVVNSEFTKSNLDPTLNIPKTVIYPPVVIREKKAVNKSKIILSVGRFGGLYNTKKYDILINTFRQMYAKGTIKDWRFILAGSLLSSDEGDFSRLKKAAEGIPTEFFPNCTYKKLLALYDASAIYWHAAGYSEMIPEHMEHFGITTVEAMNAGCVPVSFNGGGQPEIIDNGINGYLWGTTDNLMSKTSELISNPKLLQGLSSGAVKKSGIFSVKRFTDSFDNLLEKLA